MKLYCHECKIRVKAKELYTERDLYIYGDKKFQYVECENGHKFWYMKRSVWKAVLWKALCQSIGAL
jgi:hypothetical protein